MKIKHSEFLKRWDFSPPKKSSGTRVARWLLLLSLLACVGTTPAQSLNDAFSTLKQHIEGAAELDDAQLNAQREIIQTAISQVGANSALLETAFDLVKTYDQTIGPLFTTPDTKSGFPRDSARNVLAHTMMAVQQGILDFAYTPENLVKQAGLLNGAKFATATYFPGDVAPPADPKTGYTVPINATVPPVWGLPALYETCPARRPTGCYLAPGSMATVMVPPTLVNKGFSVRVGAHSWDLAKKPKIKRLDRVSLVYPITSTTTLVANPLGGGIYIEVPYKSDLGVVMVGITNAVRSPFFSATSFHKTTLDEWLNVERKHPGPWADFESDKFILQVPTSWIYNYSTPVQMMQNWDKAMDAVSDLMGRPRVRSKTVLYAQVDVLYRGSANFPGYPQSNDPYNPYAPTDGNKKNPFLNVPFNPRSDTFHELGHAEQITKFAGETEAVVNLLYVPVMNRQFGMPLDEAFGRSFHDARKDVSLSETALTWILTERFQSGQAMTDKHMKYQQRGYAKYVEIANLFGWGALSNFWYSVNEDYMRGIKPEEINRDPTDNRILRMSKAAGVDLRPLIHFWGVQPENPRQLESEIKAAGLKPSAAIYERLKYYQTVVPTNVAQYQAHYKLFKPAVMDTIDKDRFAKLEADYTAEIGQNAVRAVQKIIDLYFPSGRPKEAGSSAPKAK
jgi:hypothetical protein